MMWLLFGLFVIGALFAVYVYFFNPTLLGLVGVGTIGAFTSYVIDTYSAFTARLSDGFNVLTGGDGSAANALLLVGMALMVFVFIMNGLTTALDKKRNNFSLVR
jgi:hypothetical protein